MLKRWWLALTFMMVLAVSPCAAQVVHHTVKKGETLFGIAQKEGVSVQQIRKWNDLSGDHLTIGQTLIIKKQEQTSSSSHRSIHTVKKGESLFSIAHNYGVSVQQLKQQNHLQGSHLSVGRKLVIGPVQKSTAGSSHPTKKASSSSQGTYTVKSGDSLFRIAKAHGMQVARIKQMNGLSSNTIHVGQQLKLEPSDRLPSLSAGGVTSSAQGAFVQYKVKKTQSEQQLLQKFRMDTTEFRALNPGVAATTFHQGDQLNMLVPANHAYKNPYLVHQSSKRLGEAIVTQYHKNRTTPTTSGELYNPDALTAADGNMALGSVIFVQNEQNKQGVFVRINDRSTQAGLVVSQAVWKALGLTGSNKGRVTLYRMHE